MPGKVSQPLEVKPRIQALIDRDGDSCVWCRAEVVPLEATVEHLVPRTRGGPDHLDNLLLACGRCNSARAITPVAVYVEELLEQGGNPDRELVEAGLKRAWSSPAFSVGAHAVLERCYVAGVKEAVDLEPALRGEGWVLAADPLAIGEHYLAARLRALGDLARAQEHVHDMSERGLSRRDFATKVACRLERHQSQAAFYLLDSKEEEAFELLFFRRLRRAFGRELDRVFARP